MHQYLVKTMLVGVVAVALLAVGPAHAIHKDFVHGGGGGADPPPDQTLDTLDCTVGEIARFVGGVWLCSDVLADLQAQMDNLALLARRQASAFIFVTSSTSTGDLGGIAGADDTCNALAAAAGLPGPFKAWLADSSFFSAPAFFNFFRAPGPYILPSGAIVADDWDALVNTDVEDLEKRINIDESGEVVGLPDEVWTNVTPEGGTASEELQGTCFNWSDGSSTVGVSGLAGLSSQLGAGAGSGWTDGGGAGFDCSNEFRLYCVGGGDFQL